MEPPPMETVYLAISALYDNPNASEKEKASHWLGDVQKSIHSWKIADELLQQKKDINSCYFAAQTMRSKIQHNLSELPNEAVISLRNSLIAHLEGASPETGSAILTQLSLGLVDLALQTPTWSNCVGDLINLFSNKNDFALLELLTVLPQEIDSSSLKLGENRRDEVKAELRANSLTVTNFLKESLSSQNTNIAIKIIKCMTSWIQVRAINIQEIPQNAVIGFCLQVLRHHGSINILHDAATDCLCALLHCFEENNNDDNVERLLFDSITELENSYHMVVAEEEEVKAANYARVFTELAEIFLVKIVSAAAQGESHFAVRSLELALICVGHPDYEVSEITFNLWYRLSEEVYQRDSEPLTEVFKPHIERLIAALARHSQCEPDHPQLPEKGDDFYDFRNKVMELIKDVVFIVGSSSVFKQMFTALQQHTNASWEQTEAALFLMQAVAKNILPDEYEYVPKVVEAILSMPDTTVVAVRGTCLALLGELSEWVERHPQCLAPVLAFLGSALHHDTLAPQAAIALQKIASQCRSALAAEGHTQVLLDATRQQHAESVSLSLVKALAAAISPLPSDVLQETMLEAVKIQTAGLSAVLTAQEPIQKGTAKDPVTWLDRIAALFREVTTGDNAKALLPAAADAWTVLEPAMDKYCGQSRVMERVCRALRFVVRALGGEAAPLLPALAPALARAYSAAPASAVLYLASILVDELSGAAGCVSVLIALSNALVPRALQLLSREPVRDHPDTVDDVFRLCVRFLQRIPAEFLASGGITSVVSTARLAVAIEHRDAHCSVCKFLYDLVRHANLTAPRTQHTQALAAEIVDRHGAALTRAVVEAGALVVPGGMAGELAEVLLELLARGQGAAWLRAALAALPPHRATPAQLAAFHARACTTEKHKDMTRLLRDFAKLYR